MQLNVATKSVRSLAEIKVYCNSSPWTLANRWPSVSTDLTHSPYHHQQVNRTQANEHLSQNPKSI